MKKKIVSIESLPKSIEVDGQLYSLRMHITAWNKICLCYYAMFPIEKIDDHASIFSQVIEPKIDYKVEMNEYILMTNIVDVPDFNYAVELLKERVDYALEKNMIKIYKA